MKTSRRCSSNGSSRPLGDGCAGKGRPSAVQFALAVGVTVLSSCTREVTRISDGTARKERAISRQAYAAYARGRLQELEGKPQAALESYREVLRNDSAADEAWTRIGELNCELDEIEASRAFARAQRLNAASSSLYSAKARCALRQRNYDDAVSAAFLALRLSPGDVEISRLLVQAHRARGNIADALRYAWAHVAVFPDDRAGWLALAELAGKKREVQAQIELMARRRAAGSTASPIVVTPWRAPQRSTNASADHCARIELEQALAAGDNRAIQRAARDLRLGTLELVQFALDVGALDLANAQASLAGQIDPDDVMLWQIQLVLADWLGDETRFRQLLEQVPAAPNPNNPPTFQLLLGIIKRRTGADPSMSQ